MNEPLVDVSSETGLTDKELNLLQLLADGETLKDAAPKVNLTYQTAKSYIYNVHAKLDAKNTYNAIAIAIRRLIID